MRVKRHYEFTAKGNDFSSWDRNYPLIRVDRNGTHYYTDNKCPHCGGTGFLNFYYHVQGGICFLCGGTGEGHTTYTVYTEEYSKKRAERKETRERQKAMEENRAFLEKEGFTPDGYTYIVLGNTYEIKDRLKAAGAKFNSVIGWHFNYDAVDFPVFRLSVHDPIGYIEDRPIYILEQDVYGAYHWPYNDCEIKQCIKQVNNRYLAKFAPKTEWFGEIGKRVTIRGTCECVTRWNTAYGCTSVYKFTNGENIFTWKTSLLIDEDLVGTGKLLTVTGTIKEHKEYRGEKQTELTRCKIA